MQASIFVSQNGIPCKSLLKDMEYELIFGQIKKGLFQNQIDEMRKIDDKKAQNAIKTQLPAFTVSGTFEKNSEKTSLKKYNYIAHLDFDNLSDEEIAALRTKLIALPITFMLFISPSGRGLKVFFRIASFNLIAGNDFVKYHETNVWNWILETFKEGYPEIDTKCKNVNRLCFFSSDPQAYFNPDSEVQIVNFEEIKEVLPTIQNEKKVETTTNSNQNQVPAQWYQNRLEEICLFLESKSLTLTHDYESWLKVCFALCNTFESKEEAYKWFDRLSKRDDNYNERAVFSKFESCWKTENRNMDNADAKKNNFGFIFSRAKALGYVYEKKNYSPTTKEICQCLSDDEEGDSRLFAMLNRNKFKFDAVSNEWREYSEGKWQKNYSDCPRQKGMENLRKTYKKTVFHYKELVDKETDELIINNYNAIIDSLRSRIALLNTRKRMNNVLDLAKGKISCTPNDFDAHKWKINLKNGEFDLKNYEFNPHTFEQMHTKQTCVTYQKDAKCTKFLLFLDRIFDSDLQLMRFIRQFVGVTLVGEPLLQGFVYCYGGGANGKSTFFQILLKLLNDYSKTVRIDLLIDKKGGTTADYEKCDLHGTRLVIASEIPKNRRLNEATVKDLTGGDTIKARQPYGKYFEFAPSHTLGLFGNHLLNITGTDNGIWRRIFLVPFKISIPKEEQRPMEEVLNEMEAEMAGIFNWAVEGLRDFTKNGLFIPDIVRNATDDYRADADILTPFLEQFTEKDPLGGIDLNTIYEKYQFYCREENETAIFNTKQKLSKAISERGFEKAKDRKGKTIFLGLKLKDTLTF